MGLWIRSQDKRILIKCEDIQISGTEIINFTRYGVVELGKYSTAEKALNVLDEIASWINDLEYARNTKSHRSTFIYEMPKDDSDAK